MILSELTSAKQFRDVSLKQILRDVEALKAFSYLGEGSFSFVFQHKTNGNVYKFWVQDSAYEEYLNHVMKHQDNMHYPRLKSKIKTISTFFKKPTEDFPDKIKYVILEKLDILSTTDNFPSSKLNIEHTLFDLQYYDPDDTKDLLYELEDKNGSPLPQYLKIQIPTLCKTIHELMTLGSSIFDLHSTNIMRRGKTIVILDPTYADKDLQFNIKIMNAINADS